MSPSENKILELAKRLLDSKDPAEQSAACSEMLLLVQRLEGAQIREIEKKANRKRKPTKLCPYNDRACSTQCFTRSKT